MQPIDPGLARAAVEAHCRHWNAGDREAWLAIFADDVTFDDPVGVPTKRGREAAERSWDSSHTPGRRWELIPTWTAVCSDEVAVDMLNRGHLGDQVVDVKSIEIWKVRPDGKVQAVRAYFEPTRGVQADYYQHGS